MALKDLIAKLDSDATITLSQFRDRHGVWAKETTECVDVLIEFDDEQHVITFDEYKTLSAEHKLSISWAPSSPPA